MNRAWTAALAILGVWSCSRDGDVGVASKTGAPLPTNPPTEIDPRAAERKRMVDRQIRARGVDHRAVLEAMETVQRHRFVPDALAAEAYADRPLPIGQEQTISQPYIVALMTEAAAPAKGKTALDVGTGTGYQAAVLAELLDHVYAVEILCPLADAARSRLADLGYQNVTVRCGDGWKGWPEHAPFDAIIVAAAPREVPPPLLAQLKPGGRLVIPIGDEFQELMVFTKRDDGSIHRSTIAPVRFVPMTGEATWR